jgi:mRNA interferase RelE/StbE
VAKYRAEYSAEAVRMLEGLGRSSASRIIRKIDSTSGNSSRHIGRLSGRPEFKLRIGDYRAILDIDERRKIIFIRSIGHRSNIYTRK